MLRDPGERRFYTSSSCGVCGKGAIEQVAVRSEPLPEGPVVDRATLAALPERLRQPAFDVTGGLHATGLFDPAGELLCVREDVGRHNAMDKVVGRALREGALPLHGRVLCVSGRLSFELAQKAAVAGCPILVGVGAPSSLAIELAVERGLTLCGFARGGTAERLRGCGASGVAAFWAGGVGGHPPAAQSSCRGRSSAGRVWLGRGGVVLVVFGDACVSAAWAVLARVSYRGG